jgi:DNA-binding NarL/FixJ family response regulator
MDLVLMLGGEPKMAIRVHLADDHTMFREGLESILASRGGGGGIEVVGRSSSGGEDALALIEENKPDVVIAQIDVDLNTAREVLLRIRSSSPDSRIVVLTMFDNLHYLKALSKLGIHAYIHKSSSSEDLLATIDAASREPAGENVVVSMPRGLLERMGEEPVGALSERETEIVVLAARGLSNRLIAGQLNISEATVKRHLANVCQKIGVGSRSEAVRMALMEQCIGLSEITHADLDGASGGSSGGSDGSGNQIRRS